MDERIRGGEGAGEQVEIMGRVVYPWEQAGTGELGPGQVQVLALESGSRTGGVAVRCVFSGRGPVSNSQTTRKGGSTPTDCTES